MFKLNLLQPLKNLAGEPILDTEGRETLLGRVLANAVISVNGTTDPTKNYLLATQLYQSDSISLNAEELVYLKKQVREAGGGTAVFPTLYKGQILNILDSLEIGNNEKQDPAKKEEGKAAA